MVTAPTNDSSAVDAPLQTVQQETNFKLHAVSLSPSRHCTTSTAEL